MQVVVAHAHAHVHVVVVVHVLQLQKSKNNYFNYERTSFTACKGFYPVVELVLLCIWRKNERQHY